MVVSAISIVAVILCIIALGILLARLGWLGEKESALLAKLTTKVALPLMVVSNMYKYFTHDSLVQNASGIAVSMLSIAGLILLGLPVARLARVPANRRGVFISMFAFSNSVFIGVPVSTALFGEEAVGFALLYYIANTSIFWSVANSMIISDAKGKFDVIATIRTQPRAFFCARAAAAADRLFGMRGFDLSAHSAAGVCAGCRWLCGKHGHAAFADLHGRGAHAHDPHGPLSVALGLYRGGAGPVFPGASGHFGHFAAVPHHSHAHAQRADRAGFHARDGKHCHCGGQ